MVNDDLEVLRTLDKLLMTRDETVLDALKQAIVLSKVSNEDEIYSGPLTRMFMELQSLKRQVEFMKIRDSQATGGTGTYWTNNTMADAAYYGQPGSTYTVGTIGSIGAMGSTQSYAYDPIFSGGYVMPASPTEPDAFVLTDPDTGDSMSVKYK